MSANTKISWTDHTFDEREKDERVAAGVSSR
jgi:hypothetical protein